MITISIIGGIYYFFYKDTVINGCRDFRGENYNPLATVDNGSCIYSRETSCNDHGDPNSVDTYCECDIGYGGRHCRRELTNEYNNIVIESNNVVIDGEDYIVNTFSLIFDNDNNLLTNSITINNLDLDNIYINPNKNNMPPSIDGNEYEPNIIYNTYFSIGRFEPYTSPLGEPEWPNLNKWIWLRPNIISVVDTPIRLFQLTLKPVTNSGNILYEYGDTSIDEYLQFNFNIVNGKLILRE